MNKDLKDVIEKKMDLSIASLTVKEFIELLNAVLNKEPLIESKPVK